ncbi:MAG: WcaI family glycosyltransferase [Acidobacteriia bacterium]|nr:WcaI family glycosyltransferase [Terriglobia bacterium]
MRILVHSIFYTPELTGVAKYAAEMCAWLASRGHEVEVICPPPYYPQWKIQSPYRSWRYRRQNLDGVSVTRCPIWLPRKPGGLQRVLYAASFAFSSFPMMLTKASWRPDVVFVLEPSLLNAISSLFLARLTGALTWLQVQDFEIDLAFGLGQIQQHWLKSLLLRFETSLMRRFDVVSTISHAMLKSLGYKGVSKDRAILFPNWVDTSEVYPLSVASRLRKQLCIDEKKVVALFSGTLGAKQGIETLIEAARILSRSKTPTVANILILICGDGPAAERLRSLASEMDNVRFIPLWPASRLNDLLNIADIHILPQAVGVADSVLPSKLLGMLASGRCIAATVTPETEVGQYVKNCGLLSPPANAEALATSITRLAADKKMRDQLGEEARKISLREFRQDLILGEFEAYLTGLLLRDRKASGASVSTDNRQTMASP